MSNTQKGGDQHQVKISLSTPAGIKLIHGDHGVDNSHLSFIDYVMIDIPKGSFFCESFKLPDQCDDLEDSLVGPVNGDRPVEDKDCYYVSRGGRNTLSRMVDKEPRSGARFMVVIGLSQTVVFTAYGSTTGVISPKEPSDKSLSSAEKAVSEKFWSKHALAMPRVVNKTPHALTLVDRDGIVVQYPKPTESELEIVPRVEVDQIVVGYIGRFEDFESAYGDILHYPKNDGRIYVVSRVFISACLKAGLDVSHLRSPGILLRDSDRKVIGARGLARA